MTSMQERETPAHGVDAVTQILNASSFFGRLGLPNAVVAIDTLKKQYRKVALLVHPDKCSDPRSKEAFQKLSEAFEALASESSQQSYLHEVRNPKTGSSSSFRKRKASQKADDSSQWWDTQTWEEFEKRFRHRDSAEAALHREFSDGLKAKHSLHQVYNQVLAAERSTEHCDRAAGLSQNDLWPPRASRSEANSKQPEALIARLLQLLTHLRTVHRYCLYCGCVFNSFEDLEQNCPGFTEQDHEKATSSSSRASKGTSTTTTTALESVDKVQLLEEDPLDAFMAGMQNQLNQDLKSSERSTKKRDQPQKGWSFEQQAQQNRNHMKRLKASR
eukprot:TRINITY_DN4816_c2_g1_i1.p1 TRINITY_DN4816_c2_g1~~TRINITY_DN4816_c2_g1_i1.p1  ORF type:complete len:331 (+),score=70.34 TRINITY_DN4816_c2_g1_i1:79-1071(+)